MAEKNKFETEIDFKALPKSPSRLFGWIFPYYLILFVIVGIFFIKHMDNASFNNIPSYYSDSLDIDVDVVPRMGGIMPAIDLGIISNPTDELISGGKTLYNTNCASCHGNEGLGDGVAAAALNPAPRSFQTVDGWTNGRSFEALYGTLQNGIAGTGMIAYEFLSPEERISIIHYLRTFADFPEITEATIAELDRRYELSKGIVAPANISLESASNKISDEAKNIIADIDLVLQRLYSSGDKNAVSLFKKTAADNYKVVSIFKRDFTESNADDFISTVIKFPVESGFKMNISQLSKQELIIIYDLLKRSLS